MRSILIGFAIKRNGFGKNTQLFDDVVKLHYQNTILQRQIEKNVEFQ